MICKVPVVATFHGFVDTNRDDKLLPIKRLIINSGAAKIIFVSENLRNHFINVYKFSASKSITIITESISIFSSLLIATDSE